MKLALCNEVLRDMPFAEQCRYAAALDYDSLEVAPFTLSDDPSALSDADIDRYRAVAADAGIGICGLHWLLLKPDGLSLNGPDVAARKRTVEVMRGLVRLCARLGGTYLVHGSPAQRSVAPDEDFDQAYQRAVDGFRAIAADVEKAGVTYCIEPLGRQETNFINTVEEAVALVEAIGSAGFKTMIDTRAATQNEQVSVAELVETWVPTGMIGHVQFNDTNMRGPGQGEDRFAPIVAALVRTGYDGTIGMEPFDYVPDGRGSAAYAIGFVRGLLEMHAA